jgi:hypothetical protein
METQNRISFKEIADIFTGELSRILGSLGREEKPSPPSSFDRVDLEDYKGMFESVGAKSPINEEISDFYDNLFPENKEKFDSRRIGELFPSGKTMCMCPFPFNESGLPASRQDIESISFVRRLIIDNDGLTHGFTGTPGYYFGSLPQEIQDACILTVPTYKNSNMPDEDEILALQEQVFACFRNIESLFSSK